MYPINPVESINSAETSFGMTVLGGATSFLWILAQGLPFFIGCMENVVVEVRHGRSGKQYAPFARCRCRNGLLG